MRARVLVLFAVAACSSRSSKKQPPPVAADAGAAVAPAPAPAAVTGPPRFLTRAHLPDGRYSAVASGGFFGCALSDQHRVTCWRHDGADGPTPPEAELIQIDVAETADTACGVTLDGTVACWGSGAVEIPDFGAGPWTQVSVGHGYACAVARDGAMSCRGQRVEVVAHVPEGGFRSVDASTYHACAVELGGAYVCWGADSGVPLVRVVGNATQIATSATHGAALLGSGEITTWQIDKYVETLALPAGPYVEVTAGNRLVCGRRANGEVSCAGWNSGGSVRVPALPFRRISAGVVNACGITTSGAVMCWGEGYLGPLPATARAFAVDRASACWLDAGGAITCVGASHKDGPTPPTGTFRAISIDGTEGCAIDTAGDIKCWGFRAPQFEPSLDFVAVDVGLTGACALTRDGKAYCPAHEDEYTQEHIPPILPGTWKSVSMGTAFACGVTDHGEVRCYGDGNRNRDRAGVVGAPQRPFASVVAGYEHSCALADDGSVACWGYDIADETHPPAGLRARRLALSEKKSCALDTGGAIVCWGRKDGGGLPTGPFVDLVTSATGEDDEPAPVCGLTAASEVRCGFY